MTFYLTDDFRPPFGSHCSDFVSYIIKSLIINSLYELLIHGNMSYYDCILEKMYFTVVCAANGASWNFHSFLVSGYIILQADMNAVNNSD